MSEQLEPPPPGPEPEVQPLPGWVPVAIGLVLVGIAGLAVYTGLRYRAKPEERSSALEPRRSYAIDRGGAPGEPQAGASRVLSEGGENIPLADPADPASSARVAITGGREGVTHLVRYSARRGAIFEIDPPDAIVFVNEQQIGPANQFRSAEESYEFPDEGKFTVRIVAPGFLEHTAVVTADPNSITEIVRIARKLEKAAP